ncbi:ribonuclease H-like domain-containing protein [Tanacetum coccineum]
MSASSSQDEIPPPPPPPPSSQTPTQQTPHTVSTIKLPILKKGEYDIGMVISITTDTSGQIKVLPPRTAEEIVARERERKARTTLLMALPEDHLAKFHKMTDAKEMWDAIKSRFGGNDESKKMQKYILKQQFKGFSVSNTEGLHKGYDRFKILPNCPKLDHEDLEQIDEYDLEEMDLKWQVAMISMRMKKFYKKTDRKLQFDAKEPVGFDKTKVECYNCHKSGHFARECKIKGTQDTRRRDAWNSGNKDGSRTRQKEDSKALVTIDGEGVDWTNHSEDEDYALMACNSSDSDTEVISCSNKCKESYTNLKKLYDAQREQLSDASIEIKAYSQGLKKVEAQLVAHQQGQLWYEQKIKFMKIDLDDKTDVLTYHKKLLAEAQKEKEDLKAKVEKWHNSSKNLGKLLNTQMSANDKFGLGYGDHRYDGILSYENEVLQSVFMNKESDLENQPLNDRFAKGMHAVPPPMTGNYMPTGPEIEIDYSYLNHLIRDCDFHEKRMARKADLNNGWNNVHRVNKQNQFVPSAVLTRTGIIPVNTARTSSTKNFSTVRQSVNKKTVLTSTAMKVNTVEQIVNRVRPANVFHKTHSPTRPFKKTTVLRQKISNQKVNTAKDYPHRALKNKGIVDSGCSRHMTGNKAYLDEFQDFNGGPVLFVEVENDIFTLESTEETIDLGDSDKEDRSAQDCFVLPIWPSYSSTNTPAVTTDDKRAGSREEEQVFMEDLERLKNQEKEAYDEAEALRKKFETLVIKEGAAKPSSTNIFSTVSTPAKASGTNPLNTDSIPVSTASPYEGLSLDDSIHFEEDDSEIPPLEDIYQNSTDYNLPIGRSYRTKWVYQTEDERELLEENKARIRSMFRNPEKFNFAKVKTASTPIETQKPLVKDEEASDVDVHLYKSMIGSLMYLTALDLNIMFAVCACSRRNQMGLGNPRVSSLTWNRVLNRDYAGAKLEQEIPQTEVVNFLAGDSFLGNARKQTIVATSTT